MKQILTAIAFHVFFASACLASDAGRTLHRSDLVGVWRMEPSDNSLAGTLQIRSDFSAILTVQLNGEVMTFRASTTHLATIKDHIFIIEFEGTEAGFPRTLVVAGHKTQRFKTLLGTMYLYDDGGLFNGIPVLLHFRRSPAI